MGWESWDRTIEESWAFHCGPLADNNMEQSTQSGPEEGAVKQLPSTVSLHTRGWLECVVCVIVPVTAPRQVVVIGSFMCWSETALGALDVFIHLKFSSQLKVAVWLLPIVVRKRITLEGSSLFNSSIPTLNQCKNVQRDFQYIFPYINYTIAVITWPSLE
jgi:hypothetical protein